MGVCSDWEFGMIFLIGCLPMTAGSGLWVSSFEGTVYAPALLWGISGCPVAEQKLSAERWKQL
jgi:hypothetical protein